MAQAPNIPAGGQTQQQQAAQQVPQAMHGVDDRPSARGSGWWGRFRQALKFGVRSGAAKESESMDGTHFTDFKRDFRLLLIRACNSGHELNDSEKQLTDLIFSADFVRNIRGMEMPTPREELPDPKFKRTSAARRARLAEAIEKKSVDDSICTADLEIIFSALVSRDWLSQNSVGGLDVGSVMDVITPLGAFVNYLEQKTLGAPALQGSEADYILNVFAGLYVRKITDGSLGVEPERTILDPIIVQCYLASRVTPVSESVINEFINLMHEYLTTPSDIMCQNLDIPGGKVSGTDSDALLSSAKGQFLELLAAGTTSKDSKISDEKIRPWKNAVVMWFVEAAKDLVDKREKIKHEDVLPMSPALQSLIGKIQTLISERDQRGQLLSLGPQFNSQKLAFADSVSAIRNELDAPNNGLNPETVAKLIEVGGLLEILNGLVQTDRLGVPVQSLSPDGNHVLTTPGIPADLLKNQIGEIARTDALATLKAEVTRFESYVATAPLPKQTKDQLVRAAKMVVSSSSHDFDKKKVLDELDLVEKSANAMKKAHGYALKSLVDNCGDVIPDSQLLKMSRLWEHLSIKKQMDEAGDPGHGVRHRLINALKKLAAGGWLGGTLHSIRARGGSFGRQLISREKVSVHHSGKIESTWIPEWLAAWTKIALFTLWIAPVGTGLVRATWLRHVSGEPVSISDNVFRVGSLPFYAAYAHRPWARIPRLNHGPYVVIHGDPHAPNAELSPEYVTRETGIGSRDLSTDPVPDDTWYTWGDSSAKTQRVAYFRASKNEAVRQFVFGLIDGMVIENTSTVGGAARGKGPGCSERNKKTGVVKISEAASAFAKSHPEFNEYVTQRRKGTPALTEDALIAAWLVDEFGNPNDPENGVAFHRGEWDSKVIPIGHPRSDVIICVEQALKTSPLSNNLRLNPHKADELIALIQAEDARLQKAAGDPDRELTLEDLQNSAFMLKLSEIGVVVPVEVRNIMESYDINNHKVAAAVALNPHLEHVLDGLLYEKGRTTEFVLAEHRGDFITALANQLVDAASGADITQQPFASSKLIDDAVANAKSGNVVDCTREYEIRQMKRVLKGVPLTVEDFDLLYQNGDVRVVVQTVANHDRWDLGKNAGMYVRTLVDAATVANKGAPMPSETPESGDTATESPLALWNGKRTKALEQLNPLSDECQRTEWLIMQGYVIRDPVPITDGTPATDGSGRANEDGAPSKSAPLKVRPEVSTYFEDEKNQDALVYVGMIADTLAKRQKIHAKSDQYREFEARAQDEAYNYIKSKGGYPTNPAKMSDFEINLSSHLNGKLGNSN
ncbi:hypothetical protein KKD40_03455 [Candidatus Micrarchaeota archaeon]|nr:hypothetical protein [Candidatus Micrarchaeota archaeon]